VRIQHNVMVVVTVIVAMVVGDEAVLVVVEN
jgi:hypothetical protein